MADRGRWSGRGGRGGPGRGGPGRGGPGRGGPGRGGYSQPAPASASTFKQNGQVHQPSQHIAQLEEQSMAGDLQTSLQKMSLTEKTLIPARPGYGTKGRPVKLWTNYFELLPTEDAPFNRYAIHFKEEPKPGATKDKNAEDQGPKGRKLERLVHLLLEQLPKVPLATDHSSTMLSTRPLGFTSKEFLVVYHSEGGSGPDSKSPKFRAKVEFTGTLTFGALLAYLQSTDMTVDRPGIKDEIIQATNIVLGHSMKAKSDILIKKTKGSRNKYFPTGKSSNLVEHWMLSSGLEAFRGFFMSVRAATGRILLNVQVQHIIAWEAQPLLDLMRKFRSEKMRWEEANRMIAGLYVHVSHLKNRLKNRLKRIEGLATPLDGRGTKDPPQVPQWGATATEVKFCKDNQYISVADYFQKQHKIAVHGPVVNVGNRKNPIYMPSEVCTIKLNQDYRNKLSPDATAEMIKHAVRRAPVNAQTIVSNGIGLLKHNSEAMLNTFGVKIDPSMIVVSARVLPAVNPEYRGGNHANPSDGSWNMRNVTFARGANQSALRWSYVWIKVNGYGGRFSRISEVATCVNKFHSMLGKCGIAVPKAVVGTELDLQDAQDPVPQIGAFFAAQAKLLPKTKLLLVVLPNTSSVIYNAVKRAGDIESGVHTVNVIADGRKFAKAIQDDNPQYFANVALKFNLKLGGQNQELRPADLGFISEGKTMLVGLDVTHPAPGSTSSAPSVSSIVASVDNRLSQWPADVKLQKGYTEMIEGLQEMFKSRLSLWQSRNSQLPEEILIYRDGVGESMYSLVMTKEYPLIRAACQEVYPAPKTKAGIPSITIVICGKRHHTRFYPTDEDSADARTGSPRPGTVVDRGITETRVWDFYLQAHSALQGTAKPCHYVVVHDEIFRRRAFKKARDGRSPGQHAQDDLEALTHAMCYMFGRATKAVSLCPPAYYADLVCDRARRWLSRVFDDKATSASEGEARSEEVQVHKDLKDTMFYI
ncbi:hypothetical protein LTR64_002514 [Lithohypha guttulata]|uniref:uncharacterized protein n=1 Tax=Lithohypha guttulata TaxID=1690604 RepID=UPI002DE0660A|nr:hypothetical protein LTR51_001260 [Lithohypha guttulata]